MVLTLGMYSIDPKEGVFLGVAVECSRNDFIVGAAPGGVGTRFESPSAADFLVDGAMATDSVLMTASVGIFSGS